MLRYANWLAPYWKFKRQSINLNRWTVGASIEKLRKAEELATRACAPTPLTGLGRGRGPWSVVDQTLVRIFLSNGCAFCLEWWSSVSCFLAVTGRRFPVFMHECFCLLSSSWLPIRMERGGLFQVSNISHTNCKQHIPVPFFASTERVGEQVSEIAVRRDTLARVCGRSDVWGAFSWLLAWSVRPDAASTSWCSSSFQGDECCCYSSRWPFKVLHDVHLHASTLYGYMEQNTRCLVWMEPLMPWASVPPLGILCSLYLCMFHCCLLLMWVVTHIYIIIYITLFFWIKLKLKMTKFLTVYAIVCLDSNYGHPKWPWRPWSKQKQLLHPADVTLEISSPVEYSCGTTTGQHNS
jgi:hypothetical protein